LGGVERARNAAPNCGLPALPGVGVAGNGAGSGLCGFGAGPGAGSGAGSSAGLGAILRSGFGDAFGDDDSGLGDAFGDDDSAVGKAFADDSAFAEGFGGSIGASGLLSRGGAGGRETSVSTSGSSP
jgi:hypothetical protein